MQFPVAPWGLQGVLEYFKQLYGNPPIYIHENGLSFSAWFSTIAHMQKTHSFSMNSYREGPFTC